MAKLKTALVWILLVLAFFFLLQVDGVGSSWILGAALVVLGLVAALAWFLRKAGQGQNAWTELRKSRARRADREATRFADVGGLEEAKAQLGDVVDFLKQPERWQKAGVRLPRGVLLEGPPGSGKTLLARAVAGEAGVAVFELSASEFVEMFVGVGAARVRDSFEMAARAAPAVLFIDELDAIGRRRGSGVGGSHDEREQTLNQLLTCLDGFTPMKRVVVIAATNRADILDHALLRPGRFDLRVRLPPAGLAERLEILRIHTRAKRLAPDVSLDALAAALVGWTGAELESLCNEAAMRAVRRGAEAVTAADFAQAQEARRVELRRYDALDAVLTESASQLARPPARAVVELELEDGSRLSGEVVWADAAFLKLDGPEGPVILPKLRLKRLRAGAGTATVDEGQLVGDPYAKLRTDVG